MKRILFFITIFGLTISCTKDEPIPAEQESLVGKWIWKSTCGGYTNGCIYPDGNNVETIEFSSDLLYTKMVNGVIEAQEKYSITDTIETDPETLFKVQLENQNSFYFLFRDQQLNIQRGDSWSKYDRTDATSKK